MATPWKLAQISAACGIDAYGMGSNVTETTRKVLKSKAARAFWPYPVGFYH